MINTKKELAQAFTNEVFKVLHTIPGCNFQKAIEIAAKRPAPQFFIRSFNCTALYITRLMHGKELPITNPLKIAMYDEIHRRYMLRHKGKRVNLDILAEILQEPAPSWYHSTPTLRVLFYRIQRKEL